jgi:hypothetical protein
LGRNVKTGVEMKCTSMPKLMFGCTCNRYLESNGIDQFQFMFGCTNSRILYLDKFNHYAMLYTHENIVSTTCEYI